MTADADARAIYAVALAANNLNAAADHAENVTGIQLTSYYAQAVVSQHLDLLRLPELFCCGWCNSLLLPLA